MILPATNCQNFVGPGRLPMTLVIWMMDPIQPMTARRRRDLFRPSRRPKIVVIMHPIIVPATPSALVHKPWARVLIATSTYVPQDC